MGCGVSRPVIDDDAPPPPGLSPIRRRIEEIKRHHRKSTAHKRSKSHMSTKELLQGEEDDEDDCRKSSVSYRLEIIQETDQAAAPALEVEEEEELTFPVAKNMFDLKVVDKEGVDEMDQEEHDDVEESDYEDDRLSGYGSDFGPGSPSFREYCISPPDHSADSGEISKDDDSKSDEEKQEEMHRRKGSIVSSEGSVGVGVTTVVLAKKHGKGRKFKRVLPKGGQHAMKNLLKVRSCYTPPCSNSHRHNHSHDNPQLAPSVKSA